MARQPRTAQPKTKFGVKHQMKCAVCGTMTPKFKLVPVAGVVKAFCDPRHLPDSV